MMTKYFIILIFLVASSASAQTNFPDFLQGTWKNENKEVYEHWDRINENTLKGFSYKVLNGQMSITEYFDIDRVGKDIIYTATVLDQNQGKGVNFKLTKSDNSFTFENSKHDFPKKIIYHKISDSELFVEVTDGKQEGFSYKMIKQIANPVEVDTTNANPNYDHELAQKLGADDYGMKSYILVILKTGSNQTTDKDFISKCFRGHMENIGRLVEEGKLIVAGPLGKNDKTYRGIFILDVKTIEEAQSLLQTDMAIKEGLLDAELYPWYGSAALSEYLPASDKIWKLKP
jgi:uncharacterized protein YciI